MHSRKLMVMFAVLALVLAACGNDDGKPGRTAAAATASRDMTIEVVTHGQASDPFWSVVKNGVDQAATDLGITVNYSRPGDLRHGRHGAADRYRRGRLTRWARDLEPGPRSAR